MKLCTTVFLLDLYMQFHVLILRFILIVRYQFFLVACEFCWGLFPWLCLFLIAINEVFRYKSRGAISSMRHLDLRQNSASLWIWWVRQHQVPISIFCLLCDNFLSLLCSVSISLWLLENFHSFVHETIAIELFVIAKFKIEFGPWVDRIHCLYSKCPRRRKKTVLQNLPFFKTFANYRLVTRSTSRVNTRVQMHSSWSQSGRDRAHKSTFISNDSLCLKISFEAFRAVGNCQVCCQWKGRFLLIL